MNFNTVLILLGILFGFVLIVENMVVPLQAYVFIWITKTWVLSIISIITGMLIGYGIRGKSIETNTSSDDSFDF